jgi:hypothetical protein
VCPCADLFVNLGTRYGNANRVTRGCVIDDNELRRRHRGLGALAKKNQFLAGRNNPIMSRLSTELGKLFVTFPPNWTRYFVLASTDN